MITITLPDGTKHEPAEGYARFFRDQDTQSHLILDGDTAGQFLDAYVKAWREANVGDMQWHAADPEREDADFIIAFSEESRAVHIEHWEMNRIFVAGEQMDGYDLLQFPFNTPFELVETNDEWYREYGASDFDLDAIRATDELDSGDDEVQTEVYRRALLNFLAEYAIANDDRSDDVKPDRSDITAHYRKVLGW